MSVKGRPSGRRRPLAIVGCVLLFALVLPSTATAHGIVGKTDLPLPRWLFAWGAAVVLIVSFVALATLWPTPRLEQLRSRVIVRYPGWLDPVCGAVGVALFAIVAYAGLAGEQVSATANLAPTFIYVLFWVGLPLASAAFGDVFRAFNPWRAAARGIGCVAARVRGGRALPEPLNYPPRLGCWPAFAGILGFAWLELIHSRVDPRPSTLIYFALAYAVVQMLGMSLYGIETWTARGDAFSVYFKLFARLAPLHWLRDRLQLRLPLASATHLKPLPGTVVLLATMIGSTSFDGLEQGALWLNSIEPRLQSVGSSLGAGATTAQELAADLGLLIAVALIAGLFLLGIAGMRTIDRANSGGELARRFVHSLIPIALAYLVAHYWSLLVYQSQAIAYLASDPLGHGANIFGTAHATIDFNVLTPNSIWYVQVAALVLGHAAGLALAHDRALILYRRSADAVRSQYWMLAVMVAFTSLGLWLLSAAS